MYTLLSVPKKYKCSSRWRLCLGRCLVLGMLAQRSELVVMQASWFYPYAGGAVGDENRHSAGLADDGDW